MLDDSEAKEFIRGVASLTIVALDMILAWIATMAIALCTYTYRLFKFLRGDPLCSL